MGLTSLSPEFEPVRVGMIGVGRHARQVLLPALALIPEIRLCCVSTAHQDTLRAASERYRVKAYLGFEDMLDHPGLDAVLVVGGSHGPEIGACLEAGLHVWCETPGVTSSESAAYLRELQRKSGKIVEIGSCLRHAPVYQRLRQLVCDWVEESPGPRLYHATYYPYVGHVYNLLLYLNGALQEAFAAKGALETVATLRFANGDLASVISRRFENDGIPFESLSVSGENGNVVALNGRELWFHRTEGSRTAPQLDMGTASAVVRAPTYSMPYGALNQLSMRGYVPELEYFARRLREGLPPVCGIDDMERTLLVQEAINRSAASGQWETVEAEGDT